MRTPPNRGINPAEPIQTNQDAMPETAEAEQQTRTPMQCRSASRKANQVQMSSSRKYPTHQTLPLPRLWLRLIPILETGALMSRLSFVPSNICFIGVPVPSAILRARPRRSRMA